VTFCTNYKNKIITIKSNFYDCLLIILNIFNIFYIYLLYVFPVDTLVTKIFDTLNAKSYVEYCCVCQVQEVINHFGLEAQARLPKSSGDAYFL